MRKYGKEIVEAVKKIGRVGELERLYKLEGIEETRVSFPGEFISEPIRVYGSWGWRVFDSEDEVRDFVKGCGEGVFIAKIGSVTWKMLVHRGNIIDESVSLPGGAVFGIRKAATDEEIVRAIEEFLSIKSEAEMLESRLAELKSRMEELRAIITEPYREDLIRACEENAGQVVKLVTEIEGYVIKYEVWQRTNVSYKELFLKALQKVNRQTRAVLEKIKSEMEKKSLIERLDITMKESSLSVKRSGFIESLVEGVKSMWEGLKSLFSRLVDVLSSSARELKDAVDKITGGV